MVWVEQPVGTGFSQGTPTATSEADVAAQFLGFWERFVNTFDLHGKKVFIAGESYAGYFVPYIADAMLNKRDKSLYNLEATLIYDPSTSSSTVQDQVPILALVEQWSGLFSLNDTFMADIRNRSASCGYDDFLRNGLTYPPKGPLPPPPGVDDSGNPLPGCDIFDDVFAAVSIVNPCFDVYQIATTCPLLWDVLGFPGSFDYLPDGTSIYFNRSDVQSHINAPKDWNWSECSTSNVFVNGTDNSPPSGLSVLPGVIERSKRTLIVHGELDMVLINQGK
jgi:carboxypeptidase D